MERRSFVRTLLLSSGALILVRDGLALPPLLEKDVRISMVYNNIGSESAMKSQWGLSIWFEEKDGALLFDTGGSAGILMQNLELAGADLRKLKRIVISHNHWDHNNGLQEVLKHCSESPTIYVVEDDLPAYREKYPDALFSSVNDPVQISSTFWSTGQLKAGSSPEETAEQALILIRDQSLYLFTGCSHPGIVHMLEQVRKSHPDKTIELVAGGFHLLRKNEEEIEQISEKLTELGVKQLAASHCTGDKAITYFREHWSERFTDFNLGQEFSV